MDQSRSLAVPGSRRAWQRSSSTASASVRRRARTRAALPALDRAHGARPPGCAPLRDRFRVIALDWPAHGSSGDDHEPASAALRARFAGFVDTLGLSDVMPIGNSSAAAPRCVSPASIPSACARSCWSTARGSTAWTLARVFCGAMVRPSRRARAARWFRAGSAATTGSCCRCSGARSAAHRRPRPSTDPRRTWSSFARVDADLRPSRGRSRYRSSSRGRAATA